MQEGVKLLCRRSADPRLAVWIGRLLLTASLLGLFLVAAPRADAQVPRLAVSEVGWEFQGTDRTREFWEIANLGDTAWNPVNFWAVRFAAGTGTPQLFVRIQGVNPVPPGGVLLLEWGRPLTEGGAEDVACTTGGNTFCTGRTNFDSSDLLPEMALSVFMPTTDNSAPTVANGTMVAYFFQGDPATIDRDVYAYTKAVQSNLWRNGDTVANLNDPVRPRAFEWQVSLRMAPGPYPINHGRSANDYNYTLVGVPSIDNTGLNITNPTIPAPNTMNRAGTPGRPNYLYGVEPIPGQIGSDLFGVRTQAVASTLVANGPPVGLTAAAITAEGFVATSVFASNQWSPWALIIGPQTDDVTLLDNPKRAARTLITRARATGTLFGAVQCGDTDKTFCALVSLGARAQFPPAAVYDPATGNEHYLIVEAGTGAILHNINTDGKLRGWQPIAGVTTNAPISAHWSADSEGLAVVAWNGNQLVINRLGANGQFGAWQNIGAAVTARPAGAPPILAWNTSAKRLEIVALVGPADAAEIHHGRVELARTATNITPLARVGTITTNAAPAVAIHADSGQIRMLVRGGGKEPGLAPRTGGDDHGLTADPGAPQSGFVFEARFSGTAWGAPVRLGTGRLPGASPATPLFKAPAPPAALFDNNTKQFRYFLAGEDGQLYHLIGPA